LSRLECRVENLLLKPLNELLGAIQHLSQLLLLRWMLLLLLLRQLKAAAAAAAKCQRNSVIN